MITKSQYKRLTIVLAIPLLLLGWWLAESEVLIKRHYMTECEDFQTHFNCVTFQMSRVGKNGYSIQNGGVFVRNARLTNGLNEEVVTVGRQVLRYKDGKLQPARWEDVGIRQKLVINKNKGADYRDGGPCRLGRDANNESTWYLSCNGDTDGFTFLEPRVAKKYSELWTKVMTEEREFTSLGRKGYIASVALPLIVYMLISCAIWIGLKLTRFVIGR